MEQNFYIYFLDEKIKGFNVQVIDLSFYLLVVILKLNLDMFKCIIYIRDYQVLWFLARLVYFDMFCNLNRVILFLVVVL